MSRIDEALARARSYRPESGCPGAGAGGCGTDLVFPTESVTRRCRSPARSAGHRGASSGARRARAPVAPAGEPPCTLQAPRKRVSRCSNRSRRCRIFPLSEKLMTRSGNMQSIEQYRRLAARLHVAQSEQRTRVVMVTSALPGEGKTLSAANLALTLSESYRRQVLLVDADLRRPCVHDMFRLPNLGGLERRRAVRRAPEGSAHPGHRAPHGADGRTAGSGSDERAVLEPDAPGARGGRVDVRLGHRRHAADRHAVRRAPAHVAGRHGAPGRRGGGNAARRDQVGRGRPRPRPHSRRDPEPGGRCAAARPVRLRLLRRYAPKHTDAHRTDS